MRAKGTLFGFAAVVRYCCHWTKFIGAALIDTVCATNGLANIDDSAGVVKSSWGIFCACGPVVVSFGVAGLLSNPSVVHGNVRWCIEGCNGGGIEAVRKKEEDDFLPSFLHGLQIGLFVYHTANK